MFDIGFFEILLIGIIALLILGQKRLPGFLTKLSFLFWFFLEMKFFSFLPIP